jgi:hypothetical protein
MRSGHLTPVVALALVLAGQPGEAEGTWAGAGGALVPIEDRTPIAIDLVAVSFTAVPPPGRRLEDPRFAGQWEVSVRLDLRNPTDRDVRLTLALPEVPAAPGAEGPHVPEVVISQDGLRMPLIPRRVGGLPDLGLPCEAFRSLVLEFAPGQAKRVDTLLRQPAPEDGSGAVVARWLGAGLGRFAAGTAAVQRFSWHFGDRVRLVRGYGISPLEAPGATSRFIDDGAHTRLEVGLRDAAPLTAADIAARAAGPGLAPQHVFLPGRPRPVEEMNRAELAIARGLLLALHGRRLQRAAEARLFEELPWEECNPAFRLARGEPLPDVPLATLVSGTSCAVDCRSRRAAPADPGGDPFAAPLCWYSPDTQPERTAIRDPGRRAALVEIERRLRAADGEEPAAAGTAGTGGCGCATGARRAAPGLIRSLIEAVLG